MRDVLIVIPTYNEELNIIDVINEIKLDFSVADILFVNDFSQDNTLAILKKNEVNYISTLYNSGYACALQLGFKYAVEQHYDYVIQMDGDGQHIAKEAKRLYEEIKNQPWDIIIGSRFISDEGYKHNFFKKMGTKLFSFMIKMFTKEKITDPTSGLQVLNRRTFTYYAQMGNFPDYPDANILLHMLINGYKIKEISVKMRERTFGKSMHSGIIKPIKYMIMMIYSIVLLIPEKIKGGRKK